MEKVLPTFQSNCVTHLMGALLDKGPADCLPTDFDDAQKRVLLILDGLGWEQLQSRSEFAPTLSAMQGGPITTVAPSTTAAALTSITTSLPPGEHGVVGYRFSVDGYVLNALRWSDSQHSDLRRLVPPDVVQPFEPFLGTPLSYVTKAEFSRSGFNKAHLRGGRPSGYRCVSTMVHNVASLIGQSEDAVYCYYDGVDKVAHEYGLEQTYEAELSFVDRLVAQLLDTLPSGTRLVVSADHGQVDCGSSLIKLAPELLNNVEQLSGEGRFRWLHAKDGRAADVFDLANELYSNESWVVHRDEIVSDGWFGSMNKDVLARLGDVALLPFEPIAYDDPADSGPFHLKGRHGSLTSAEMLVPCLAATA